MQSFIFSDPISFKLATQQEFCALFGDSIERRINYLWISSPQIIHFKHIQKNEVLVYNLEKLALEVRL